MTSFTSAIKAGIESANIARAKKKEIQNLFDTLSSDVEEAFDGVICLELKPRFEAANANPFGIGAAVQQMLGAKGRHYTGIMAVHSSTEAEVELGEWKVNDDGYPVTLVYSGTTCVCETKEELFEALSNFISATSTAEKLKQLSEET